MPLFGQKVPFNNDVIVKCMCGMCPVQAENACSKPKLKMMMDMRARMDTCFSCTLSAVWTALI